jgi:hypothetical protein
MCSTTEAHYERWVTGSTPQSERRRRRRRRRSRERAAESTD